ncbi:hypothetical protein ACL6C3_02865 [Capilliphycus salinus ALCB114379]|uniref:hypothetical protein n=1 Tax=Capilliphycus salinus TaxID=2768948 RepID=UPI0039A403E6
MINSIGFNSIRSLDEHKLYAHLQKCVETESPQQLIERFRNLFLGEVEYQDAEIWAALGRIVDGDFSPPEFSHILNRCCYILINRWLKRRKCQWAIYELVQLFQVLPNKLPHCWTAHRLRSLVKRFIQSEQYHALRRLAKAFKDSKNTESSEEVKSLDSLIIRYPYLYEHFFLTDDSTDEQRQEIRMMRHRSQLKFDHDLYEYMSDQTYSRDQGIILLPTQNPTLLPDKKYHSAVNHFTSKVDGHHTYPELAKQFIQQSRNTRSYRTFKEELYEYISSSIDPKYGRNRFNQRLYQVLQDTLNHNDGQKVNDALLAGTCRKLFNFMVIESLQQPSHFVFVDLLNNLGATSVIGALLKLVLVCRKVKADLERRFSVLFSHYSSFPQDKVFWLVEALENVNIAFSLNFGSKKLSF